MSATGEASWIGGMAQESSLVDAPDDCDAEVAHLYRVLHRYRRLTHESRWDQSNGRTRMRTDGDERPVAVGAWRGRQMP
jgi:hypothetical protein